MSGGVAGTRGQRVYSQHGQRHSPRGSDPNQTDVWVLVETAHTAWSSSTTYSATNAVSHLNFNWVYIHSSSSSNKEPGVDANWPTYWQQQGPCFVNGENASSSTPIPNPVPLRFRLSVGPPNECEYDNGTVSTFPTPASVLVYTQHQIEIQGDVTGLVIGDTVFVIPLEYQHDYDVPYHTHDIYGAYVPCRLLASGEFIWGQV